MLEVKDLEVTLGRGTGRVLAVNKVSFCVNAGDAFGIAGESGSGKSTLLRAICGFYKPVSGSIRICGGDLRYPRDAKFHRNVQMVFQDPYASLHPLHTVQRAL